MKSKIQITIPKPCHENWTKMSATEKGRFCTSCQKNVIDFTTSSDTVIVKAYKENPKLCGQFIAIQLNRKLIIPQEKKSIWVFIAASIIAFLGIGNQEIKAQGIVRTIQTDNKFKTDSISIELKKGAKKFIGIVYDENKIPLPGATFYIKGSDNKFNTNFSGEFSILAKKGDILVFSYIGYNNIELKLKNDTSLKVYLKNEIQHLMGEVIIVRYNED
jgi:hypothetical protein